MPEGLSTFQSDVSLVTSDVTVRDRRGQFQANLTKDDFEVYEDCRRRGRSTMRPAASSSSSSTICISTLATRRASGSSSGVLGYSSTNPDPTQRRRVIEIRLKTKDADLDLRYRKEYTLKPAARR